MSTMAPETAPENASRKVWAVALTHFGWKGALVKAGAKVNGPLELLKELESRGVVRKPKKGEITAADRAEQGEAPEPETGDDENDEGTGEE